MSVECQFKQDRRTAEAIPAMRARPEVRLERLPGAATCWRWIIHRGGHPLMRSEVTSRGAEAASDAGATALARLLGARP